MLIKNHLIELIVNGKSVDLEGEDSLGIRFNEVLYDPEKIGSTSASYSFEFQLPATRNNNKIFDHANVLSKNGKFHQRYDAEVEADGSIIFKGTLVINSYKDNKYSCNLVAIKTYSLEEIFGDKTLDKIPWNIDFSGVTSINDYNQNSTEVKFPLISYGVFAKDPYNSDDVYDDYTSKFVFDKWNKWYVQSFYPSHNMLETVRKAFEWKGYQVFGDAFVDDTLKNIYMSTNLADDQDPAYNIGNPVFGKVNLSTSASFSGGGYMQELQFPYENVKLRALQSDDGVLERYNFDNVFLYDLLSTGVTTNQSPSYMYQPNEHVVVIPESGWYMIELTATTSIQSGTISAALYTTDSYGHDWYHNNENITKSLSAMTPIEIALVRNYDDNYELIKGKHNIEYTYGTPQSASTTWLTCFPHEDCWQAKVPTEQNDLTVNNNRRGGGGSRSDSSSGGGSRSNGTTSSSGNFSGYRGTTRGGTIDPSGGGRIYSSQKYGYMYSDFQDDPHQPQLMCYDQAVSPAFICGLSSYQGGVAAVMRNGYSWSKSSSIKNEVFAPVNGYEFLYRLSGSTYQTSAETTDYNANRYVNCPAHHCSASTTSMNGNVACCVWLEKNDVINLFAVSRTFFNQNGVIVPYSFNVSTQLKITAFSNRNQAALKSDTGFTYNSPTEFPVQLNLGNFLNSGTTIQSWIQDVSNAFNLEIVQSGNQVFINKRKKLSNGNVGVVNIDDRVDNGEAETERINYPKSMCVSYKTNSEEWGFEQSVPSDKIDLPDWEKYGDSGYTKIYLNDDSYVTEESNINTNFSYCWYDTFTWTKVDTGHTEDTATTTTFSIPVISKATYMVDGYDYADSEAHDGYGLTQRFWFTPSMQPYVDPQMHSLPTFVWTDTYPQEQVYIYTPINNYNGMNLSYKNDEVSLLDYFNIRAELASNYVNVEVYLTPEEYNLLKNGGKVKFDDDLYDVVEIQGYDATGNNKTELKLMKKTA